jgi:hypothetical protein
MDQPDKMTIIMADWKMGTVFDQFSDAYAKFYNPSEHLAVDEVIVLFKGELFSNSIFQRNINAIV